MWDTCKLLELLLKELILVCLGLVRKGGEELGLLLLLLLLLLSTQKLAQL